jgi:DegV family protein with EDD domain
MIGFCTDSNSCLPRELAEQYQIEVVPLTVSIDGEQFAEGVDLDADAFYARFDGGGSPQVATAAPSPGRFAAAYQRLARHGATEILSVHVSSAISGTLNAAHVGALSSPVPVRLVDTGTASFGITCCLWEAADAVDRGAAIEEAAAIAEAVGGRTGNVFVVGALDLCRAGGRLAQPDLELESGTIPVLVLGRDGKVAAVGQASTVDAAVEVMAREVLAAGRGLRVGLSIADAGAAPLALALAERLAAAPEVLDMVRYRVAPSVGAHTGPGTAGAVWYRAG